MPQRDATTTAHAALRTACAPLGAGLVLLACGIIGPANAVIITVSDNASTSNYALQGPTRCSSMSRAAMPASRPRP